MKGVYVLYKVLYEPIYDSMYVYVSIVVEGALVLAPAPSGWFNGVLYGIVGDLYLDT